jgi:hypothetical protein
MATSVTLKANAIDISGTTSGTVTLQAPSVAGTTTLTLPSTSGTILTSASTATTSTNLAGGSNGTIPYQSASGTTQMLAVGTSGQVLQTNGAGAPTWVTPSSGLSASADNTFTGTQTFSGTSSAKAIVLNDAAEVATVSATAATGTINYDITTQSVLYYTSNASANWTVNFRASSGTSLNTLMATGESMTVAFLVTQGSTAYYNSAVQVDGTTSGVTTRWFGGAPTAGNASGIDSYRYLIIKTGSATFTVLASNTQFKA